MTEMLEFMDLSLQTITSLASLVCDITGLLEACTIDLLFENLQLRSYIHLAAFVLCEDSWKTSRKNIIVTKSNLRQRRVIRFRTSNTYPVGDECLPTIRHAAW